jgi:hypothetical protein
MWNWARYACPARHGPADFARMALLSMLRRELAARRVLW